MIGGEHDSASGSGINRPTLTQTQTEPTKKRAGALLCLLGLLAGLLIFRDDLASQSLRRLSVELTVCLIVVQQILQRNLARGFWSLPSVFFVVAAVFHGGLPILEGLGLSPVDTLSYDIRWFLSPAAKVALVLVAIALVSFAIGSLLVPDERRNDAAAAPHAFHDSLSLLGLGVLAASVVSWLVYTIGALGFGFILSSYGEYRSGSEDTSLPYIYLGIGIGAVMVTAGGNVKRIKIGSVLFAIFVICALPIGLRGDVLYPAAACAAILARRRRMPRPSRVVVLILLMLTAISAVQQVRQSGLGELTSSQLEISPVSGLGELGATLRTVVVVVQWHEEGGEPYEHGATYIAPLDRPIRGTLLGQPIPASSDDHRLMNVEFLQRVGPIGGSFISEAFHNFGLLGVCFVPGIFGLTLGALNSRRKSVLAEAAAGILLVILLRNVRNSFTPVPFQLTVGLFLLICSSGLERVLRPVRRRAERNTSGY